MSAPVLAVDVGNSRFKIGLFTEGDGLPTCLAGTAVPLAGELPWGEVGRWRERHARDGEEVRGVVAGSNPAGIRRVLGTWPKGAGSPTLVDDPTAFPLEVDIESPETVGVDRLLNAVAANVLRDAGRPAIVVDSGTATTVDAIDGDGRFRGGAILPGFELAARSLHQYTALLPFVPVEDLDEDTPAVGRNTRDALRSGLHHGQIGAVRELVREMTTTLGDDPLVLLTGGGGHLLGPRMPEARFEPQLTLQGLVVVGSR